MPIRRLPLLLVACAVAGGLPRSAAAQPFDPGTISGVSTGLALRSAIQLAAVHCLTAEGDSLRGEALRMYEEIGAQQRRLLPLLVDYMRRDERAGPPAGYDSLARAADETIRRLDGVVERARGRERRGRCSSRSCRPCPSPRRGGGCRRTTAGPAAPSGGA